MLLLITHKKLHSYAVLTGTESTTLDDLERPLFQNTSVIAQCLGPANTQKLMWPIQVFIGSSQWFCSFLTWNISHFKYCVQPTEWLCERVRALSMTRKFAGGCLATWARKSNATLAPNRGRLTEQPAVTAWWVPIDLLELVVAPGIIAKLEERSALLWRSLQNRTGCKHAHGWSLLLKSVSGI